MSAVAAAGVAEKGVEQCGLENVVLVMLEQLKQQVSKADVAAVLEKNHGDVLNTMRELEMRRDVKDTQTLGLDSLVTAIQIHYASFIPRDVIVRTLEKHGGSVVDSMGELQSLADANHVCHPCLVTCFFCVSSSLFDVYSRSLRTPLPSLQLLQSFENMFSFLFCGDDGDVVERENE